MAADSAFERALAIKRQVLPPGHPDIATTLANLAQVNAKLGRYDKAESGHREALQIKLANLDSHHPEIGVSWANLGHLFKGQAKTAEAKEAFRHAIAVYEARLAPNDFRIGLVHHGLGDIAALESDQAEAFACYSRALGIYRASIGPEHRLVAEALADLGLSRLLADDLPAAESILQSAHGLWRELYKSANTPRSAIGLATTLLDQSRLSAKRGQQDHSRQLAVEASRVAPGGDSIASRQLRARIALRLGHLEADRLLDDVLATGNRELRLLLDARTRAD